MTRALRALARRPGYTVVAVATLALGLGVNAAIGALTRTVLLRPLPYRDADRLVMVAEASPSRGVSFAPAVPANYAAWRSRATSFEETAAWRFVYFTLSGRATPVRVQGLRVTPSFFPLLGVAPALGRGFARGDDRRGNDNVVLLSNGFWRRQFGGDPLVVGRPLVVDGDPCTIVGVLPASFKFFRVLNRELDVWRPLVLDPAEREHSIQVYGKLAAGTTVDRAQAELDTLYATLPPDQAADGWSANVSLLSTRFTAGARPILSILQWAVALVLCIACANVANLVLASSAGRRQELAVRTALGANRWQIARTLAAETTLLAAAGAAAAVVLAVWVVDVLDSVVSHAHVNRLEPFRVDAAVVAATLGIGMVIAIVFALLPARRAADADVLDALKDSSHGVTQGAAHRRLRGALIVAELALAIVLLTTAVALTEGAHALHAMARGVVTDRVMTAQVSLGADRYGDSGQLVRFADDVLARLRATAGVESVSLVNYPPLSVIGMTVPLEIAGRAAASGQEPVARYWIAAPGYFATVGVPVVAGRDFSASDTRDAAGVAIVSEGFARRFWGRTDVLGEHVTAFFPRSDAFWIPRATRRPLAIVGVAADVREDGLATADLPQIYLPYSQNPTTILTLVARTTAAPSTAASAIRDAVRAADPDQPTFDEKSLDDVLRESFARPRELAWLLGAFAALALVLSAIGVYGVIACLTGARTREIGIRVALGATTTDILTLVVGDAMKLTTVGVAAGVAAAPVALRLASASVFGVSPWNPLVLVGVAALLTAVCAAAAAIPAYRAARAGQLPLRSA